MVCHAMIESDLGLLSEDKPLNESEKQEVIENAQERLLLWKKRFLASGVAFLLSCASVYPFLHYCPVVEFPYRRNCL